jgi:hypothetical protein
MDLARGRLTSSKAKTNIRTRDDAVKPETGRLPISTTLAPSSPRRPASRTLAKGAVPSSPKPYDVDKWSALLKCDDDLAKVAEKLRLLGENCVDELARSYLILNDKKYLPDIVRRIIADARVKQTQAAAKITKDRLHEDRKIINTGMERVPDEAFKSLVRALTPGGKVQKETFVTRLISNSLINVLTLLSIFLAGCFLIAFSLR